MSKFRSTDLSNLVAIVGMQGLSDAIETDLKDFFKLITFVAVVGFVWCRVLYAVLS